MTTEMLHVAATEDSEASKKPREDGEFEGNAKCQGEEGECIDVALERYQVFDTRVNLVGGKEPECEWEDDEVAEKYPKYEHEVGCENERCCVSAFFFSECWQYKAVELVDDVGHDDNQSCIDADHHVDDELTGEFGVDESDVDIRTEKGWEEVAVLWGKDYSEQFILETECHNGCKEYC